MVLADKKQGIKADWKVYPQIGSAGELAECLCDVEVVEACGFREPSRRRALKVLLDRAERDRKVFLVDRNASGVSEQRPLRSCTTGQADGQRSLTVLLEDAPTGWPADGVLLCPEGVHGRQADRLMERLYERDCVILGLITGETLHETERRG